jgi:DNA-binding transcriptional regulator YbjK
MTAVTERDPSPRVLRILDAAVDVLGERGLRGLTHRAVDQAAGLPEGSSSAYLRTRTALLEAVAEHVARRLTRDIATLTDRLGVSTDETTAAHHTVGLFLDWLAEPAWVIARLELSLESSRRPPLARSFATWRDQLETLVLLAITRTGHDRSLAHARAVTASLEGVLLRAVLTPEAGRRDYVEHTVHLLLGALSSADE